MDVVAVILEYEEVESFANINRIEIRTSNNHIFDGCESEHISQSVSDVFNRQQQF